MCEQDYRGEEPPAAAANPHAADEEQDDEKPSDLSFKSSVATAEPDYHQHSRNHHRHQRTEDAAAVPTDQMDAYKKFKSNITQRFSQQDATTDPGEAAPASSNMEASSGGNIRSGGGDRPPPPAEVVLPMHVIKTEEDAHPAASARRSRHQAGELTPAGGLFLPVIRERLPPPGFPAPDRDFLPPPSSLMSGKIPPPPMDLLMPTLAPIHPAAYPPTSRSPVGPPVPIFALNAKGSYYVPMSVELAVIAPFMALYTEETYSVLHPVTISVNFQVRINAQFKALEYHNTICS
jgi:hypothetical protein